MFSAIFLRVDHPAFKELVDSFEGEVTNANVDALTQRAVDLGIEMTYGFGYDLCFASSQRFKELEHDERYVQRIYNPHKEK